MPSDANAVAALGIAAGVCAFATPLMIRLAHGAGILDYPGGYKRHFAPTPCLGGLAILLAVLVATVVTAGTAEPFPVIACGAAVICLLGIADDRRAISPALRVAIQAGIGASVWAAGGGWNAGIPDSAELVFTVFWIVLAVNAFNLIDNLDGVASSAAAASATGVAAIAFIVGAEAWTALVALAVLGACLAFLFFNLARPARIFLGDGGSTLLGFLIAVSAMGALSEDSAPGSGAVMVLLLGIPLLDTALVMVSRRRRGVRLLTGGRDHLTHRIYERLGSRWKVAATTAGAQLALSALAASAIGLGAPAIVAAVTLYCVAAAAAIAVAEFGPVTASSEPRAVPSKTKVQLDTGR
jgi:UDP-GlcNAc:undecaprenyl-phosphate/decaprenyl-phosphate GlcNAc-1-phosphate transferase